MKNNKQHNRCAEKIYKKIDEKTKTNFSYSYSH
jgi:hypothetical protein